MILTLASNILGFAFFLVLAFWAGAQVGRLITLWQVENKNKQNKGDD